jgi:putative flippase GtrA
MLGPDPNSFMSLVMACIPTVVVAFATRDAWTWRRRQIAPALMERERKPWIS